MLGDAMARSAGWGEKRPMKPIEIFKQRAPTGDNPNAWSIGLLNLTEGEADQMAKFARAMQTSRWRKPVPSDALVTDAERTRMMVTDRQCRNGHSLAPGTSWCAICSDPSWDAVNSPASEPLTKPSEPGNRFSGLDLDT